MAWLLCSNTVYPWPWRARYASISRIGRGVGVQKMPVSSSRMYIASVTGSDTGSLDHGVSRLLWLFSHQEKPPPDSVTSVPNEGLAMTLLQGAGVSSPGPRYTAYSRASRVNPPNPLK